METIVFMTSIITFYLKGEISQEQNFVKFKIPNTILGLIPLGAGCENIPITQISAVGTNFHLKFSYFIIGLITAFIGMSVIKSSIIFGLLMLIIGVLVVICSFQCFLVTDLTSGRVIVISFVIFEKSKAEYAAAQINALVSNRIDDTNVRVHTDREIEDSRDQTDRIVDAINGKGKRF